MREKDPPFGLFVAKHVAPVPSVEPFKAIALPPESVLSTGVYLLIRDRVFARAGRRVNYLAQRVVSSSLDVAWELDEVSGLALPADALSEWRWDKYQIASSYITPSSIGMVSPPAAALDGVAWRVLAAADQETLALDMSMLAFLLETAGPTSAYDVGLALGLSLAPAAEGRLLAEIGGGRPAFDPRCLRWIVRELAAFAVVGRRAVSSSNTFSDEVIARAFFSRCLGLNVAPSSTEVLRAVWFLHERFLLGERDSGDAASVVLSATAAASFGVRMRGTRGRALGRAHLEWRTSDSDPAFSHQATKPSALRERFHRATGLSVDEWFAGATAVYVALTQRWASSPGPPPSWMKVLALGNRRFSRAFVATLKRLVCKGLPALGTRVLEEMRVQGMTYRGLGSTPQHDAVVFSSKPLLSIRGKVVPVGADALCDSLRGLPARALMESGERRRSVGSVTGLMFEAYVQARLRAVEDRHAVLDAATLDGAYGSRVGQRCDGALGHSGDYVLLEVSRQTLGPGIAAGRPGSIEDRCKGYLREANQAIATAEALPLVVARLGLPAVRSCTYLVVTEDSLPYTPALAHQLRLLAPERSPKFVIGIDEMERVLELATAGWNAVELIQRWQADPQDVPLWSFLNVNDWAMPGKPLPMDWARHVVANMPLKEEAAAA